MIKQWFTGAGRMTRSEWWQVALPVLVVQLGLMRCMYVDYDWIGGWTLALVASQVAFGPAVIRRGRDAGFSVAGAVVPYLAGCALCAGIAWLVATGANPAGEVQLMTVLLVSVFMYPLALGFIAAAIVLFVGWIFLMRLLLTRSRPGIAQN